MRRSWLWLLAGVVSLIATMSLAGQQTPSGQGQSNLAGSSSSSVPRLVKFSGAMKDATGKPLSGPVEITFGIYREQADAAPLWQETQTLALDEQGRYTVLLGAMQGEGLPMELFATGEGRWLSVQAQGAEAQPRVLLVSVPYALKAADAETLSGKPVSDFVLAQQLKEQVQTAVAQQAKKQQDRGQQALAMVLSQGPTPMVTTQGQTSFTCPSGTSGDCVTVTQSSTGRALYAVANSTAEALRVNQSGTGYGLLAMSSASGVYGVSTATTGTVFGIRGDSASTEGRGILGLATATTGGTIGLWGNAASTSGTGLLGDATATTGTTYGLRGRSYSSSGTGILAYAVATTGTTKGLWAQVYSADGTAAVFQNTASGKLLSGLTGTGTGTEVFSVAGSGNLTSAGSLAGASGNFSGGVTAASFTGSGAGLTNLTAANISAGTAAINISGNAATATDAQSLGGVAAAHYARLHIANTFTATQTISSGDISIGSGNLNVPATTGSGVGVINLGGSPFIHAYGNQNTFVGGSAGNFSTTGMFNTATGNAALYANTTGSYNTANGDDALGSNTKGSSNTASGAAALRVNTEGNENTASGQNALYSNSTGSFNTASGVAALVNNSTGSDNTAIGRTALADNCNGVTTGCTADGNTAVGFGAGVGGNNAYANVTGAYNTFIGYNSAPGTPNQLTNATAIGANASVSESNALVLGGTTGSGWAVNVGIGTSRPRSLLEVVGNASGALGPVVTLTNTGGTANAGAALDFNTYPPSTSGTYNPSSRIEAIDAGSWGNDLSFQTNNPGAINNGLVERMRITSDGYVGIGTTSPATRLQVAGDIRVGTTGTNGCVQNYAGTALTGTCSSDARLKKDVQPFGPVLAKVAELRPVHFAWDAQAHPEYHFGPGRNAGLIAQEVERVFPQMVSTDERGFKTVNYSELPYLLLAAIRELKTANDGLRAQAEARETQWTERLRAQQVQIQKLTGQVQDLQKVQQQVAWLEARLARVEKPRNQAKQVKRTAPPKVSGTEEVIAKVQF